jgi:hypothetical protein
MEKIRRAYSGWRLASFGFFIALLCASPAVSADVTLAWDPNSEPDLEGYGVYLRKSAWGPPYTLAGYLPLDELKNDYAPSFVVTGLEKGFRYYFAVTAYDAAGNESPFSSAVCADVGDTITPCAAAPSNSFTASGGGGAGCFISAASEAKVPKFLSLIALVVPGCIRMLATNARKN